MVRADGAEDDRSGEIVQGACPEFCMTGFPEPGQPPDPSIPPDVVGLEIRAVTPGRLAATATPEDLHELHQQRWWVLGQQVSADCQMMSLQSGFWEAGLAPAVQRGRSSELVGLIAGGGEQLALALAALTEAELWNGYRRAKPPDLQSVEGLVLDAAQEMVQRAMAELAGYYLLGVGHTVANVTARTLALHTARHPQLLDAIGSWFLAGSEEPRDWLSLNRDTARSLRRLASTARPAIQLIAEPATRLVQSPEWQELSKLRSSHYHRRRPQAAGVLGVPLANPWSPGDGVVQMRLGADQYTDGDNLAVSTTDLARRLSTIVATVLDDLRGKVTAAVQEIQAELSQAADAAKPPMLTDPDC